MLPFLQRETVAPPLGALLSVASPDPAEAPADCAGNKLTRQFTGEGVEHMPTGAPEILDQLRLHKESLVLLGLALVSLLTQTGFFYSVERWAESRPSST